MSRTSAQPWLYRYSRSLLGAIATAGAVNTAYLTYLRFTSNSCPTNTCAVLGSRYATVFGQPLSLFGLIAYLGMIGLALVPLLINPEQKKLLRKGLEEKTWPLLFAGATGMFIFSLYLMNIMFSEFVFGGEKLGAGGLCPFCIFSAILATAMFVITLLGRDWESRGPLLAIGSLVGLTTLIGSLIVYTPPVVDMASGVISDATGKPVLSYPTSSGESEIQLAKHLKNTGAVMYGSYRCPACCAQKLLFGKEAAKEFNYTECMAGGKDAKPEVCQQEFAQAEAQLKQQAAFPTWKVNGKYIIGAQSLQELAQASGYSGPQNFTNASASCQPL
ncbi:MAG: hypothetical protein RLZZ511_4192 [Cyanobacteriota bacterium]|jgi:uncharacterized membrane protein